MKVYLVTGMSFPNGWAAVSRIKCYARALIEKGVSCEVIVYCRTEGKGKCVKNTDATGIHKGIPYRYVSGTTMQSSNCFVRYVNNYFDIRRTEDYLRNNIKKGDVLFLYIGKPVEIAMRFMNVAHKNGAYCIRDLCELPYGTGLETTKSIRLRKKTLEVQFPHLDGVISISDTLLNLAKLYTQSSCKHIKVPIMVDYEQYFLPDKSTEAEVPYIFHAGSLYEQKDGIIGMLEAFGIAVQRLNIPIKLIITGNISNTREYERQEIKRLISQYHLEDRIVFTGYLKEEELRYYLSKAALVIINKYRTQQNNYCFSTKLGEYLAAAKPVIITNVGEAMNWLEDDKNAFIVEPNDTEALVKAIVQVFENREEANRIGIKGQEVCRDSFDFHIWGKPLVDFLNQLGN